MAGGDLDISQVDPGVEHGGDEGIEEHVRMGPGDPHSRGLGEINALRATAPIIAGMPPAHVGRQVARVTIRLGMTHGTVTEAVTDALSERYRVTGAATPKSRSLCARHSRST